MEAAQRYLAIALRLGILVPGWIEGYAGPPEVKQAVDSGPDPSIEGVLTDAAGLAEDVSCAERDPRRLAICFQPRCAAADPGSASGS